MALIKKIKKPVLRNRHKRILALIKENRFRLFWAMLCMLVIAVETSATAFLIKPVNHSGGRYPDLLDARPGDVRTGILNELCG
jgi:hypothetical protein